MNKLWFRAQNLDNQSLDPMAVVNLMENELIKDENKRYLLEKDVAGRQQLAQEISEVSSKGEEIFFKNSHSAFLHGDKFLLKTPSDQLDESGRIAPLLCYGHVPNDLPESWSGKVVDLLVDFAEGIERTVSDKSQRVAREGAQKIVEKIKRRRRVEKTLKRLGLGAAIAVLALVMKSKRRKDEEIDKEMGRRNQNIALGIIAVLSVSNAILAAVILSKK